MPLYAPGSSETHREGEILYDNLLLCMCVSTQAIKKQDFQKTKYFLNTLYNFQCVSLYWHFVVQSKLRLKCKCTMYIFWSKNYHNSLQPLPRLHSCSYKALNAIESTATPILSLSG